MSRTAPRPWFALLIATVAFHLILWWAIGRHRGVPLDGILQHFDSGWYSLMVGEGYRADPRCWVFYPLYPLAVRGLVWVTSAWAWQAMVGTALSTACLAIACRIAESTRADDDAGRQCSLLYPKSAWGHALLLLSPASFALHSHHTEGLFLALSIGAFALASRNRPHWAAVLAGLSALTRAQGVVAAVCVGLWAAREKRGKSAILALAASGAISAAIYAPWPLYQWHETGTFTASVTTHALWGYVVPREVVLRRLFLRDPDQHADAPTLTRYGVLLAALGTSIAILRRNHCLGVYLVLTLLANPVRGDPTYSVFRYVSVLFPVLYLWGDALGRLPRIPRAIAWAAIVAANLHLAANYARGIDAY